MANELSDAQLIAKFLHCDDQEKQEIILVLYERYKRLILKICYGYIKDYDLANDLFHDVFVKIIENLDKLKSPDAFRSWTMTLAKNLCVDYLRKTSILKDEEQIGVRLVVSYGSSTEDKYIGEIDRNAALGDLQACVKQLAVFDLNVFKLRLQGLKTAQIIGLLKIEKANLRRSYDRIKYVLETCMGRKGFKTSMDELISLGELGEQK